MDNNLKKLNRVQLLQLLVQLSEDRDALVAENTELRNRAEAQPQPKSIATAGMKVGSIAEAALQANGYFESAQNAADDYLREIKRMRDHVAARTQAQQAQQAQQVQQAQPAQQAQPVAQQAAQLQRLPRVQQLPQVQQQSAAQVAQLPEADAKQIEQAKAAAAQEARAISDRILARANAQAKSIVDDAQTRSDAIIADANRKSHTIISRANRQAEAIVSAAQQQATPLRDSEPTLSELASPNSSSQGLSAQQQVSARQDRVSSPSSTAEIRIRARHVRVAAAEG